MEEFGILFLSIIAGAIGYLIITFWVRPILRYKDIKYQVASDLMFFQNTIGPDLEGNIRKETLEGMKSNRRHAADLAAIYGDLPSWYQRLLKKRKEDPQGASQYLIGLSNEMNRDEAKWRIKLVKDSLKITFEGPREAVKKLPPRLE